MSDASYEFLNTRVRSMSRELLDRAFYEETITAGGVEALIDVLLDSPYEPELREALSLASGVRAVESAIRRNLYRSLQKVRASSLGEPKRLIETQLGWWDVGNIVALARAKLSGAGVEETLRGLLPVGQFDEAQFAELAAERDLQSLADALTTWNYQFAFIARRVIRESDSAEGTARLELELERAYFSWALAGLSPDDDNEEIARRMVRMQIDLQNVVQALKLVAYREAGREVPEYLAIPGGRIAPRLIERLRAEARLEDAFELLAESSYFAEGIERGILAFGQAHRLGVMERFLEMVVIEAGARLFRGDPLGAGVPLGFIFRKISEFRNLQILVRGKAFGVPANTIREELLVS